LFKRRSRKGFGGIGKVLVASIARNDLLVPVCMWPGARDLRIHKTKHAETSSLVAALEMPIDRIESDQGAHDVIAVRRWSKLIDFNTSKTARWNSLCQAPQRRAG
jgi:hypothetical protein